MSVFKVGDKVKVLGRSGYWHGFADGDIVTVTNEQSDSDKCPSVVCTGYSNNRKLDQIIEVKDLALYIEPKSQFKVGQIVRITSDLMSGHRFKHGELVRVIEVTREFREKWPFAYKFERLDRSFPFERWVHPVDFEKLPSSFSINDIENSKRILNTSDVATRVKKISILQDHSENLEMVFPPKRVIIPHAKYRLNILHTKNTSGYVTVVRKNGLHIKYENVHRPKNYVGAILKAKDSRIIAIGINNKIVYQK